MADESPDPDTTAYSARLEPYASKAGSETEYLQLLLPDRVEDLGWQPTTASSTEATTVAYTERTQPLNETEITYLVVTAATETDQTMKLRPYNGQSPYLRYALSIPVKYTDQDCLASVGAGDSVNYEIDVAAEELRIYHPDQFSEKLRTW